MKILEMMQWRFACKHYDKTKKIPENELKEIMEVARLTPSSFGLQAWKFVVVTNQELKEKLAPVCYNQPQITEASALVFCCSRTDLNNVTSEYTELYKKEHGKTEEEVKGFKDMVGGMISGRSHDANVGWAQRQVYLPAQSIILAAAEKNIDSCPMEGFDPKGVAKVLGLPENFVPTVLVSLGYRNMEVPKKVRFSLEQVVEFKN
jgi:nitroreductase